MQGKNLSLVIHGVLGERFVFSSLKNKPEPKIQIQYVVSCNSADISALAVGLSVTDYIPISC